MASSSSIASASLDRLPPELQCHILERIPDWKTLRALIQASPRYLEIYTASKEVILSHVAHNCLTSSVYPIALNVFEMRNLRRPEGNRDTILDYLQLFRQMPVSHPTDLSLDVSKALLQFHNDVEFFISDFAKDRLAILENYKHPEGYQASTGPETFAMLSDTEHTRIARAFYLLELYGQLFYDTEPRSNNLTASEVSTLLLQRLRDWELEEFLCIRSYMVEKLEQFFNQVQDDYMQSIINDGPGMVKGSQHWDSDDWFFSTDGRVMQELWQEACLTRGLGELKAMFSANTSEQRLDAIGDEDYPYMKLGQALKDLPSPRVTGRSCWPLWLEWLSDDARFHDDAEVNNEGWLWATMSRGHPRLFDHNDEAWEELRRIGYTMWDQQRLKALGILTERSVCGTADFSFVSTILTTAIGPTMLRPIAAQLILRE
jgi:hypothetical protein